jgi:hypothetical protein
MVKIERSSGQSVQIGPYTLQILAVHANEVVFALLDPDADCASCGERPAPGESQRWHCPVCATEAVVCQACAPTWECPECNPPGWG